MADRIFAGVLLLVAVAYTFIAFTAISAPFQYDPLGPESWPRIIGIVAVLCAVAILVRPDIARLDVSLGTLGRLAVVVVLLMLYAGFYRPLGFIISTVLFATALSMMLGARPLPALLFGLATGIIGFFVGTILLELNLPAGPFAAYL